MEIRGRDKTYDLGKGIKVTVARILAPGYQATGRLQTDSSILRSPTNSKTSIPVTKTRTSQSPLLSHSRMDKDPRREQSKESLFDKNSARVQIGIKQASTPSKQAVIDFSREGRINVLGPASSNSLVQCQDRNKTNKTIFAQKANNHNSFRQQTSETYSSNLLKHRSERNLSQNGLTESVMSDIPDSGYRALTKSRSFLAGKDNTAHFGQFQTIAEIVYPEKTMDANVEPETDLLLQWQDLVARCESLEFCLSVGENAKAESISWLAKKREAIGNMLAKIREKLSFLLNHLYPSEEDEEVRVRIAALFRIIESGADQPSELVPPDSPTGHGGLFVETELLFAQAEELIRTLEILADRKKVIIASIRSGCGWYEEFASAGDTAAERGEREERLKYELLSRTEEIQAMGVILPSDDTFSLGLSSENVAEAAKWVYEDQVNRLRAEGIEKLGFHIAKTKDDMKQTEHSISNMAYQFKVDKQEIIQKEIDDLLREPHTGLLSFLHSLISIDRAVRLGKNAYNFSVDLVGQLTDKLKIHLPSASQAFDSLLELEFDGRNYNTMKAVLPLVNLLESHLTSLFKLKSAERVSAFLEEGVTNSAIFRSPRTPHSAVFSTLLKSLEALCEAHLLNPSSPDHLSASDMSTEPLPPDHLLQLCVISSMHLSLKKKHYAVPLLETAKQISAFLDIFDKTVWVDQKSEFLPCSAFLYEIGKLQMKVRDIKAIEIKAIEDKLKDNEVNNGKLKEMQQEYSRLASELKKVKRMISTPHVNANKVSTSSKQDLLSCSNNRSVERQPLKVLSLNQRSAEKSASKKSVITLTKIASRMVVERGSNGKSVKDIRHITPPKPSNSSIAIKLQQSISQKNLEQSEDDPMAALDIHERDMVMEYCGRLSSSNSRNPFLKKLIKLLEGEFNLDQHCIDWIARGVAGIKVRKGPRIPFGYSGSKKIDALETWSQMVDGRVVDLDKMGFGQRVLRFNSELECFEMLKPTKKAGVSIEGLGHNYCWDTATSESLQGYNIVIEEVSIQFNIDYKKSYMGTTWQT